LITWASWPAVRAVLAEDFLAAYDAGAVDQPMQAAKSRDRGLHRCFSGGFLADIRHGTARVIAQLFGLGGHGVGVQIHQHHLGAGGSQHFSGGRAEAGSPTTDQKNLVLNLHYCCFLRARIESVHNGGIVAPRRGSSNGQSFQPD
jgi:hypothetical protein